MMQVKIKKIELFLDQVLTLQLLNKSNKEVQELGKSIDFMETILNVFI